MYNKELDRIYGVCSSDPSLGRWYANKDTKDSFVRYFDDYREITHKREFGDEKGWVLSIGGPGKHFQVGNTFFNTANEAKKYADNRDEDDLFYLEQLIDSWRSKDTTPVTTKESEIDYGF